MEIIRREYSLTVQNESIRQTDSVSSGPQENILFLGIFTYVIWYSEVEVITRTLVYSQKIYAYPTTTMRTAAEAPRTPTYEALRAVEGFILDLTSTVIMEARRTLGSLTCR